MIQEKKLKKIKFLNLQIVLKRKKLQFVVKIDLIKNNLILMMNQKTQHLQKLKIYVINFRIVDILIKCYVSFNKEKYN